MISLRVADQPARFCRDSKQRASALETVGLAEGAYGCGRVLMLRINGVVEVADVGGGEFAGEVRESRAELGKLREGGFANDRNGIVGRKIMMVVGKSDEPERVDEPISGIAGDDVHLVINQGAVDEAEVHYFRGLGEMQIVACCQSGKTVGAFKKFVTNSGAPFGSKWGKVGNL